MKKRMLSLLVCAIMVLVLLPTSALAATDATLLTINGLQLTSDRPYYHNGVAGGLGTVNDVPTDANAYFDVANKTLTLDELIVTDCNATVAPSYAPPGMRIAIAILIEGDLSINVIGESVVSVLPNPDMTCIGLGAVGGSLTFTGTDKLTVTAGAGKVDDGYSSCAVYVGNLTISSGTLECNAASAGDNSTSPADSAGMNVQGDLTITGGNVTCNGGDALSTTGGFSAGLVVANNLDVSGDAVLTAEGAKATGDYALSAGIDVYGTATIQDGEVIAESGIAEGYDAGCYSYGFFAGNDITVSGGSVTATAGNALLTAGGMGFAESSGLSAEADIIDISGGTIIATGGESDNTSSGIHNSGVHDDTRTYVSGGEIAVSGSASVTATGGEADDKSYGVWCAGSGLGVSGGSLTATAKQTPVASYGVFSDGSEISVSGGKFTAKTLATTGDRAALSDELTCGADITAQGSTSNDGSNPVTYVAQDNLGYLWASVQPSVISVGVNPFTLRIDKGGNQAFYATVMGKNNPLQTVTWSVTGNTSTSTTIDEDGVLSIAADETATTLTIKAISDEDNTKFGTATVTVATKYPITQGANGKWTQGSADGLTITANADYDDFRGIQIDGETVGSTNYTSKSGSTIVTLKPEYLKTLSAGTHTIVINFARNGYAETVFTVVAAASPATGDSTDLMLLLCIVAVSAAGVGSSIVIRRKQDNG